MHYIIRVVWPVGPSCRSAVLDNDIVKHIFNGSCFILQMIFVSYQLPLAVKIILYGVYNIGILGLVRLVSVVGRRWCCRGFLRVFLPLLFYCFEKITDYVLLSHDVRAGVFFQKVRQPCVDYSKIVHSNKRGKTNNHKAQYENYKWFSAYLFFGNAC